MSGRSLADQYYCPSIETDELAGILIPYHFPLTDPILIGLQVVHNIIHPAFERFDILLTMLTAVKKIVMSITDKFHFTSRNTMHPMLRK